MTILVTPHAAKRRRESASGAEPARAGEAGETRRREVWEPSHERCLLTQLTFRLAMTARHAPFSSSRVSRKSPKRRNQFEFVEAP